MLKNYHPDHKQRIQLEFINIFNTAGVGLSPVQFKSIDHAKRSLSAPFFWGLYNKLTVHEMVRILELVKK